MIATAPLTPASRTPRAGAFRDVLLLVLILAGVAFAPSALAAPPDRFAGEGRLGSQPPFPIHLELHRSDGAVTGTVSIVGAEFEVVDGRGDDAIVGRFRGPGGAGDLTLRLNGDILTGVFDLAGQPGTIIARRTPQDAETYFRPPEQRLNLTTAQWIEDLDRLAEVLTREHASPFHRISRERFDKEVEQARAAIPALDGVAVALLFRKLGAMIGDGHTSVESPHGRPHLPIEFYHFEDGVRVVGASPTLRRLLEARLLAVDDVPTTVIVERLRAYIPQGETDGFFRSNLPDLLTAPDALRAIGVGAGPSVTFTFERDGKQERVELTAAEGSQRISLGGGEPLWRRNKAQGFWSEALADGSVYVNWRSYDGLAAQGAALLRTLDATPPRRLIVDLRDNGGGDFNIGRAFIEQIRSRPWLNREGALYVMIGRRTFSAAMTNAVDFKQRTKATLVGEPAGAAPNNWQEVRAFHLPNSGLRVSVSTVYYEFLPGQSALRPDRHVPPEPGDWGSDADAGVRAVLNEPPRERASQAPATAP